MNLHLLRHMGHLVHELQPLAPLRLASMIRSDDMAGLVDYFMPVPGGTTGETGQKGLQDFREVFALTQRPGARRPHERICGWPLASGGYARRSCPGSTSVGPRLPVR